ncbi:META domain-containing protein [Solwaraspora sp. WMMD1047]|uniref:META domain-containing protein n=1 Tax=Solwaraspora sp. WMMD1047 TaxID=3016102 RepID=UPI0024170442|nr:META domain-containing protein [Solwaraspora sp. WMMD1047]MDG4830511.1 META domain-containing protein [Solwaraspora sp. WMMD1047]
MRGNRQIMTAVLVSLLLAGCAGSADDGSATATPSDAPGAADAEPVALIGLWAVEEAAQEEAGAVLRVAPTELSLWRDCGNLSGSWRADTGGLFVAAVYGASGCELAEEPTPAWLREATSFRTAGEDRLLLNVQGDVLARLAPGGKPEPAPDILPEQAEPPVVTDEVRRAFAPPAPLPADLTPLPAPEALLGRWVPATGPTGAPDPAFVELTADGSWRGSDGCNALGGRWVAASGGPLLATSGASTLVGCDNVPIAQWLSEASQAGLDGDVLVLVDAKGTELGRLRPAG